MKRAARVAEGIREELARLVGNKVRDPRVRGVVIARVALSDDLRDAKVYVRLLEVDGGDEARRKDAIVGLSRASGMLRGEVTKALKLRVAPELKFFFDEGQDKMARVEELLYEIREDEKKRVR